MNFDKSHIINDIEEAMRAVGYSTTDYACVLSTMQQNQADWAEGFATLCVDEALRQTGEYASFCHTDLKEWAAAVSRSLREVAIYIVGAVCRSMHLACSADELCDRLSASLYIDDFEPLRDTDQLKHKISEVNLDSLFKPHKSMEKPLPEECQEIVMKAKRDLRRLFGSLAEKLTKIREEATRKEAEKLVEVTSWVKDFRSRKAEMMEIYGKSMEEDVDKAAKILDCSRSEAIDELINSQDGLLDDNPFYQLYERCNHVESKFVTAVRRLSGSGQGAELDKFIEMMAKREWLEAARSGELGSARGKTLRSARGEECAARSEELTESQQQALSLAVERGYMSPIGDGTYDWKLSKVLLAYFLGRLFCGDYISTDNVAGREEWTAGGKDFPEQQLCRLFGLQAISINRRSRLGKAVPEGYEKIEGLIEEIE